MHAITKSLRNTAAASRQFPWALRVPGLKHVSDRILGSALQSMQLWPSLLEDLRVVELFLGKTFYRDRFRYACISDDFPQERRLFQEFSTSLKGLRWQAILAFTADVPGLIQIRNCFMIRSL